MLWEAKICQQKAARCVAATNETAAKFWIPDPQTLFRRYGGYASVRILDDGLLASVGDTPRNGTIIREEHQEKVWFIENGLKRWITTPQVLSKFGGNNVVQILPDNSLAKLPEGQPITN